MVITKLDRIGWVDEHLFSPFALWIWHVQWPLRKHKNLLKITRFIEKHIWELWASYTFKNGYKPPIKHRKSVDALLQIMKEDYEEQLAQREG